MKLDRVVCAAKADRDSDDPSRASGAGVSLNPRSDSAITKTRTKAHVDDDLARHEGVDAGGSLFDGKRPASFARHPYQGQDDEEQNGSTRTRASLTFGVITKPKW